MIEFPEVKIRSFRGKGLAVVGKHLLVEKNTLSEHRKAILKLTGKKKPDKKAQGHGLFILTSSTAAGNSALDIDDLLRCGFIAPNGLPGRLFAS